MIACGETVCPSCGGELKYYDKVPRRVLGAGRTAAYIKMRRFRCGGCGRVHRELRDDILPRKHYGAAVVRGVLKGEITCDMLECEDYPCERTMTRWKATLVVLTDGEIKARMASNERRLKPMGEHIFAQGSVPVSVAAKVYGKDAAWVRAGIVAGWLPIGKATRNGRLVTSVEEIDSKRGRINFYISPKLLWEQTGHVWKGER